MWGFYNKGSFHSFNRPHKSCQFEDCTKEAILSTVYCTDHILFAEKPQHLIKQCCYLFTHGEQCRVPVHDVLAPLVACNDHQNAVSFKAYKIVVCRKFNPFSFAFSLPISLSIQQSQRNRLKSLASALQKPQRSVQWRKIARTGRRSLQ